MPKGHEPISAARRRASFTKTSPEPEADASPKSAVQSHNIDAVGTADPAVSRTVVLRDYAIAFSLANLCFLGAWRTIASPQFNNYHFELNTGFVKLAALSINVLLLGAFFWIGIQLVRRASSSKLRRFAELALLVSLIVPLNVLRVHFDVLGPGALLGALGWYVLLVAGLSAASVVIWLLVNHWSLVVQAAKLAVLMLFPIGIVAFSNAAWDAVQFELHNNGNSIEVSRGPVNANGTRLLVLVFDELDQRVLFADRPASLELPEFDRLRSESLYAANAFPPAAETVESIPSLLTGELISKADRIRPDELMITFGGSDSPVALSEQSTILSRADELGFRVGVVGWYHPYTRLFARNLTSGYWRAQELAFSREVTLSQSMLEHLRTAAIHVPLALRLLPPVDERRSRRQAHGEVYVDLLERAKGIAVDPSLDVLFVHVPIPHLPGVYDRVSGRLTSDLGHGYLDNLALADRTLGEIRRAMEAAGTWDRTHVLVMSDHWWRIAFLKALNDGIVEEDSAAFGNEEDRRVPFLLKPAGKSEGLTFDAPFNTVLTYSLCEALMAGRVTDAQGAAHWLDANRTIGESPYYETTYPQLH